MSNPSHMHSDPASLVPLTKLPSIQPSSKVTDPFYGHEQSSKLRTRIITPTSSCHTSSHTHFTEQNSTHNEGDTTVNYHPFPAAATTKPSILWPVLSVSTKAGLSAATNNPRYPIPILPRIYVSR
ncbi:hypothetical protein BJ138DRAFT_1120397 [Hygrophoropsis aurantiaca]|uniref:Uncharacterized protein n=1 Tax=Hygrophoropsis aurantiaca TaxID=72124 RepID=A0ACB7ZQD1_9AGAM|nr:hypothetical protein BJ138DRAFT_1120397 [Hygrophoropsis aurantiaca]